MENIVTIFRNLKETDTPFHKNVLSVLERIKNGDSKELVQSIRSEKNKDQRNLLKRQLPAICFSGRFSKRNDDSLIEHSGLICLDFDGYQTTKELMQAKETLSKSKYSFSVFVSPSGNGLKVIVKIPDDLENHVNYFNSLEKHFNSANFDKTSKNVSRVCYESYDPQIYINTNSAVWNKTEEREYAQVERRVDRPTIPITDENKIADILVKWWVKKYPMTEGQRNQNCFILAAALNDFGVNKELALYILSQYSGPGFEQKEIDITVTSAYADTTKFGSKYYEDEDRVNAIRAKARRGVPKKEIRYQLQESGIDSDTIDSVITKIESENKKHIFWEKNDKGQVKLSHIKFKQFLEDHGFYKYFPSNGKEFIFVRVSNNLIDNSHEGDIKDFVLNYILELDDEMLFNFFAEKTKYFGEDFLSMLSTIDVYFIDDNEFNSYLYFRNCVVCVSKGGIKTIDYIDLGGYVWKDRVIDRDFVSCEISKNFEYQKFISNVCASNEMRVNTVESAIGFLMHSYKDPAYCPAIILNDEVISDDPEGGTGKGIFVSAIGKMKKTSIVDGKSFKNDDQFKFQTVDVDTQVMCFDDAKKRFDFESLFSVITEGITINYKNLKAIKIPFKESPKVIITTNYAIKGAGNSFARRKFEIEFHQYYNMSFTPADEFGHRFFDSWNDEIWAQFDNYMIYCLQKYLRCGLIKSQFINLNIRQLSAATTHEFIEWCGLVGEKEENISLMKGFKKYKNDLYFDFINEYPDYAPKSRFTISRSRFYKWLNSFAIFRDGVFPEEGRDTNGRWIIFRDKPKENEPDHQQMLPYFDDEDED